MFSDVQQQIINAKLKDAIKKIIEVENECYYDLDGKHKEKAIKSHSIWNSGILKLLASDNKVFWIDPKKRFKMFGEDEELFHEVITSNATVYRGFCKEHDDNLFEQIEKNNEYTGNLIQNFLYSYRAFSYQHVQNVLSKIAYENMYTEIYKFSLNKLHEFNKKRVGMIRASIDFQNSKSKRGDAIYLNTKKVFNECFKKIYNEQQFINIINEKFIFKFYRLNKKIDIACSGIGDPLLDINGRMIISNNTGFLFLNLFPKNQNESYFILGLLKNDEKNYKSILEYLNSEYEQYIQSKNNNFELVVQNLVVNGSENIVMSKNLYQKLKLNDDIKKFRKQFEGSVALLNADQKYYQDLLKDHGYKLL